MALKTGRFRIRDFAFYIGAILVAIAAFYIAKHISWQSQNPEGGILGTALTTLDNLQEKQLDAYLEVNRLLTTLGTTLLGALGFLLFGGRRNARTRHLWAALLGALFVATSIFYGYLAYLFLLSMLQFGPFDLTSASSGP
ncbi:MAG: hypothetical protein WCC92_18720, partial [Candidatus Korobacteraceae bacterium]